MRYCGAPHGRRKMLQPIDMAVSAETVIELSAVRFSWSREGPSVLHVDSLRVARGERLFLRGPSGSGKSTLLSLIAGVVTPQQGSIKLLGHDTGAQSGAARDRFRADHIGYIFQMFNLIPYLSVIENVGLPCHFSERRRARDAAGRSGGRAALSYALFARWTRCRPRSSDPSVGRRRSSPPTRASSSRATR